MVSVAAFDYTPLAPEAAGGEDGWYGWNLVDRTRYNSAVLGDMRVRKEGGKCRRRMFPERRHTNLVDNIHGAVTLGLIDIALFATMHINGSGEAGPSVTVELSTQFVGAGDPSRPLDAVSEIVRETGRMLFLRGFAVQPRDDGGEDIIASYSGIVRKMRSRG
jgi:acyl-coenzyme A thioesterase PaaI-like protein